MSIGGPPPVVFIPPSNWKSSFTASALHWFYSATVSGLQRDPGVEPTKNGILMYQLSSNYTFKKNKTYQYEVEVKGNFTGIDMLASYQWTGSSMYNDTRQEKIIGVNAGTGSRYYFYSSPNANMTTNKSIYLLAKGVLSGTNVASPRITNLKITEVDWLISGYKRFNPGIQSDEPTFNTLSNVNYDGWSYDKQVDTFWWTNKPNPTMGATGLATGVISSNYIVKAVTYKYFNLTFEYRTFTGAFGSDPNNIKIQTAASLNGARTTLYTLTQSTATNSAIAHQIYGLQGNGKYLFFVGSTTSNVGGFQAALTNIKVEGGYHPNNNQQFLFTNSGSYSNPTVLQILGTAIGGMTFSFVVGDGSSIGSIPTNLNLINAQFGNGTFRAGVWENGVWNSGWRVDTRIYTFDSVGVAFRTIADRRWRIQLVGSTSSVANFSIGNRISIGNIVAIDINETRKLLKGYFTIINKSDTSIIVETDVTFPFRRIERDSTNHRIKVTKNVWLSGAFLNGYYTGIWNYGLFRGFPDITEMFDTQWIDGIFDGGHFNSIYESFRFVDSYYTNGLSLGLPSTLNGNLGLSFSTPHGYVVGDIISINKDNKLINPQYDGETTVVAVVDNHLLITDKIFGSSSVLEGGSSINTRAAKGLIQNFKFTDNNIAGKISSQANNRSTEVFQFNSWIDVNYYNTSAVNIGKPISLYDTKSKLEYTQNNLYGYPTNDVLSSESTFRDSYTFNTRNYKLGTKYKIYSDGIGKASEFEKPFNMASPTSSSYVGLNAFLNYGWTFSGTYSKFERTVEETEYNTNVSAERAIKGEELVVSSTMSGSILNNTNISIENDRYTIVELDIKSYSIGTNSSISVSPYYVPDVLTEMGFFSPIPSLNFNNINQFKYSYVSGGVGYSYYTPMAYLPIYANINHLQTPGIKKYEYFFNKPTLSIRFMGSADVNIIPAGFGGTYQSKIILDNLKYYEVDMIPFFQYFVADNIYQGVSVPWQGIAPFIDYTNSNFSFIDNINIGLGSVQTQQSFVPISGVGIGIGGGDLNPTYDTETIQIGFGG